MCQLVYDCIVQMLGEDDEGYIFFCNCKCILIGVYGCYFNNSKFIGCFDKVGFLVDVFGYVVYQIGMKCIEGRFEIGVEMCGEWCIIFVSYGGFVVCCYYEIGVEKCFCIGEDVVVFFDLVVIVINIDCFCCIVLCVVVVGGRGDLLFKGGKCIGSCLLGVLCIEIVGMKCYVVYGCQDENGFVCNYGCENDEYQ